MTPLRPPPSEFKVSPADARVLHFGPVDEKSIEQVKGITYSMDAFLGCGEHSWDAKEKYHSIPYHPNDNQLYHIVLYLAPGDYHRFHSPVPWTIEKLKHFTGTPSACVPLSHTLTQHTRTHTHSLTHSLTHTPTHTHTHTHIGKLFSVSPGMVRMVEGLFVLNERIIMLGQWQHGFFSMAAVGATNVGSIELAFDKVSSSLSPSSSYHPSIRWWWWWLFFSSDPLPYPMLSLLAYPSEPPTVVLPNEPTYRRAAGNLHGKVHGHPAGETGSKFTADAEAKPSALRGRGRGGCQRYHCC